MIITVSAVRIAQNDKIYEIFTWQPFVRYTTDSRRMLYHLINRAICYLSIHKYGFKLIDITYEINKTVYVYEFTEKYVNALDKVSFSYFPVLGEKKCKNCLSYKRYKGKEYCGMKNKKINRHSCFRCYYWIERARILRMNYVYQQTRSSCDD
jgi:hypothetical protein